MNSQRSGPNLSAHVLCVLDHVPARLDPDHTARLIEAAMLTGHRGSPDQDRLAREIDPERAKDGGMPREQAIGNLPCPGVSNKRA